MANIFSRILISIRNFFRNKYVASLLKIAALLGVTIYFSSLIAPQITNLAFLQCIEQQKVKHVSKSFAYFYALLKTGETVCTTTGFLKPSRLSKQLISNNIPFNSIFFDPNLGVLLLCAALGMFASSFIFKATSSNKKCKFAYDTKTFAKVGGNQQAIIELKQIVDYLRHPSKYKSRGIRLPKGILLYGPPGTGKTLVAKVYQ